MKIAIVDDKLTEQNKLSSYITSWASENNLPAEICTYQSGESFSRAIQSTSFDIVFMDIIMEGKNGIVIKPYTADRISKVLDDAARALGKHIEVIEIGADKFVLSDILYVFSDSNYCEIFTMDAQTKVRISFTELSQKLEQHPSFMIVGRGIIVNFENTSHISGNDCVMSNGEKIPVSRRKLQETERAFYDWQFKKMLSKE